MVANFGFKITFLNSFLCEKIDSFQKFLKHALEPKSWAMGRSEKVAQTNKDKRCFK